MEMLHQQYQEQYGTFLSRTMLNKSIILKHCKNNRSRICTLTQFTTQLLKIIFQSIIKNYNSLSRHNL